MAASPETAGWLVQDSADLLGAHLSVRFASGEVVTGEPGRFDDARDDIRLNPFLRLREVNFERDLSVPSTPCGSAASWEAREELRAWQCGVVMIVQGDCAAGARVVRRLNLRNFFDHLEFEFLLIDPVVPPARVHAWRLQPGGLLERWFLSVNGGAEGDCAQ